MRSCVTIVLAIAIGASAQVPDEPSFRNAGFELATPDGKGPADWQPVDFGTGGQFAWRDDGPHSGSRYAGLIGAGETQRCCWRQSVLWDDTHRGVAVGGWYRTRGAQPAAGKGPSIRFLFNYEPGKWDHLAVVNVPYPAAADWTEVKAVVPVPRRTRQVVVELFHWFTPGETHWDDVWIRPATTEELAAVPLPPEYAIDRPPVPGRSIGYWPEDGVAVALNPPPFRWLPSGRIGEVTYRLQVARDEGFERPAVDLENLPWCARMLGAELAPGEWWWRYGVERPELPVAWSRARRFVVREDATPWPFPPPEAFRVSAARPRLFIPADRLADYRERARSGDLKPAAEHLVAAVQKYAGEPLVAEPDRLPDDQERKPQVYVEIIRSTRPPMDRMEQAALAYLLTGDRVCGEEAKRRLLHFFSWDPHGSTSIFHNDEPAMWVMMRGTRAYDWTWDLFTPDERSAVEGAMRERAADFYRQLTSMPFENNPYSSHPGRTIGFLGEAALSFLPDWPEARTWLEYITTIYWGVYPAWGKDDGGWNEGPGYWSAYMSFALHFVTARQRATGIDLAQRPFFRNTPYYKLYVGPPHSQISPFGDGTQWRPTPAGGLMYAFSTLTGDPVIRWYANTLNQGPGSDVLGVVLRDDSLRAEPPTELPLARLFEGVGLACLRTDLVDGANDVGFVFKSSPFGAVSHGHNEQNCFMIEAYGEPLAIASGYYNYYGSPHHDQWTRQTKAKCGITIDGGIGQDRGWEAQGRITGFVGGAAFDLVCGDAGAAYGGRLTRAVREVVHVRPGRFVMRDDLASNEPHSFEYRLHALDAMTIDEAAAAVFIRRPKASLAVRFLLPDRLRISQTDQFEPPPTYPADANFPNNWHITAATEPTASAEFLTLLEARRPDHDGSPAAAEGLTTDGAHGVWLDAPDDRRVLVVFARPGAERWQVAALQSDGRVAAVRLDRDGRPTAWLLHGGTTLAWGDRRLVAADRAVTLSVAWTADGGRVDSGGDGARVDLWWPEPIAAVTRSGAAVAARTDDGHLSLILADRSDSLRISAP